MAGTSQYRGWALHLYRTAQRNLAAGLSVQRLLLGHAPAQQPLPTHPPPSQSPASVLHLSCTFRDHFRPTILYIGHMLQYTRPTSKKLAHAGQISPEYVARKQEECPRTIVDEVL